VPEREYRVAREVVEGLRHYFDRAFPVFFLYRFERLHFDAWWRERRGAEAGGARPYSELCSAEHFLRIFTRMPALLAHATLARDEHEMLVHTIADLLKWMARNAKALFSVEHYHAAHPDYVALMARSARGAALPRIAYDKVFIEGVTPTDPLHRRD
jgi:hypothetical protein